MDLGLNSYSLTMPNSQVRVQLSSGGAEFDSMLWAAMATLMNLATLNKFDDSDEFEDFDKPENPGKLRVVIAIDIPIYFCAL